MIYGSSAGDDTQFEEWSSAFLLIEGAVFPEEEGTSDERKIFREELIILKIYSWRRKYELGL